MLDKPHSSSRRRKDARPRELLDAALAVFVEKGFAAARPEEIALRAGVSKGTLYLYFHSKEGMLAALIEERFSSRIAVGTHDSATDEESSRDLLRSVLTAWRSTLVQGHAGGIFKLVFAEARAFPALAQFWLHEVIEPLRPRAFPHRRQRRCARRVSRGGPGPGGVLARPAHRHGVPASARDRPSCARSPG